MSTFGAPATAPRVPNALAAGDHNVAQAGNDGVSTLTWSPRANILVSGNWDSGIRCWEVQEQNQQILATPKAQGTRLEGMRLCEKDLFERCTLSSLGLYSIVHTGIVTSFLMLISPMLQPHTPQ